MTVKLNLIPVGMEILQQLKWFLVTMGLIGISLGNVNKSAIVKMQFC